MEEGLVEAAEAADIKAEEETQAEAEDSEAVDSDLVIRKARRKTRSLNPKPSSFYIQAERINKR